MNSSKPNKTNVFFSNNISGMFFNPLYFIRAGLSRAISIHAAKFQGKLIDLGCGTKPYRSQFKNVSDYVGLDIEVSGNSDSKNLIDVYYDGHTFPLESNSVDGVFSSETFEHIFNLEEILLEIRRVLKKDGLVLATCPFLCPEHEVPYDYARYTSFSLKYLFEKNGFEIVDFEKTGNYFIATLQLHAIYINYFINKIPFLYPLFFILFISPIFILGSVINKILPKFMKRKDLYLNNVILAKKIS